MICYRPKDTIREIGFLKPELFNDSGFKKPIKSLKYYYSQQLKVLIDKFKNVRIVIVTFGFSCESNIHYDNHP